ncbi:non-ribosomal peptide synthetase [Streptomyces paromomycinus]|uniref:Phenyloxazoline synthase MbtB n=1 Tax=Streptomyces paromomycinus TaxID=92743 RepID=A0A401VTX5_STREY|nr:non-ribosomal peptide synthetase [Streptomyces paromomycinus]GCD40544.1 non-ribosomal peptide synthetase [Streptomyces paromomycinus]
MATGNRNSAPRGREQPGPGPGRKIPLTSVQSAYRLGREDTAPLGGVACHMYFEFDGTAVDPARLRDAVTRLQERHPPLRTAFPGDDGTATLLGAPTARLLVRDLTAMGAEEQARTLAAVRAQMSGQRLDVARGQVLDVRLTLLSGTDSRLHIDVDLLAADPPSIGVLLTDLARLYGGAAPPAPHYDIFARQCHETHAPPDMDLGAWRQRLDGRSLAPPALPLTADPETVTGARFSRRVLTVPAPRWRRMSARAHAEGLEPDSVLLAAFAHTLGRFSTDDDFIVSLPEFPRLASRSGAEPVAGDFTRLRPASIDVSGAATLRELVHTVDQERRTARRQQFAAGPAGLRELARARGEGLPPAGAVYTNLLDADLIPACFERCFGPLVWMITQSPQVWLDCLAVKHFGGVCLAWDLADGLFPAGLPAAMTELGGDLLTALCDQDWNQPPPSHLPATQQQTRNLANATYRAESGHLLHQRFFELAAADPGRPALLCAEGTVTRGALADDALRMAALLRHRGLRPGEPVAVCLKTVPDQIRVALAVLAAGGCYVPIGTEQPERRRTDILRIAGVRKEITDADAPGAPPPGPRLSAGPRPAAGRLPPVDQLTWQDTHATTPLRRPVTTSVSAPAYIIFTSGSTGRPKGVEITHRSAVNTVDDINHRWAVGRHDRGIAVSALDFDLSVYEIFGPLAAGGAVVVPAPGEARDPQAWLRLVRAHRVTVWHSVPGLLDALITAAEDGPPPDTLRLVLTGGDWIGTDLPARLRALVPGCRFVACGGATEGSVYSNYFEADGAEDGWSSLPYGRPLGNQRYRVVDGRGRDCPDWVTGELWIGGVGVARGYRAAPEQTARRFVHHAGARWYRTGDLGRYRPGAVLEFLGRTDHQVKINGYRIAVGEIEAALASHHQVARAVAVVTGQGPARRLIAYLLPVADTLDQTSVREHARTRLPSFARPDHYLLLDELPLDGNGKVDRGRLAAWDAPEPTPVPGEPPRGAGEQAVAEEWSAVLGREVSSRHERFVDLGGDSQRAMRLASALRARFGRRVPLRTLLEASTVAAMAELIGRPQQPGRTAPDDGTADG